MESIRKTSVGLIALILTILLVVFGVAFGIQRVFGTPDSIKSSLKDSGIYQNIVGNILDKSQEQSQGEGQGGENQIPLDRPEVKNIVQNAASPEYLQAQTENILDAVYAWLNGDTPKLTFAVDLTDMKTRLADGIEQYTVQHMSSLPACTSGSAPSGDTDPFNATCLPPDANVNQMAAEAKNQILNGEFLKDSRLSADTIELGGGKTLAQQLEGVNSDFKMLVWVVYGLGLLALLLALGLVFLSTDRRSGLKKLSIIAISTGAFVAILGLLGSFALGSGTKALKEPLQQSAAKVAELLANDIRGWWVGYGIVLIVLGTGTLLALHFTKPKSETERQNLAEPDGEDKPEPTPAKPMPAPATPKPKPRPAKRLVQ